MANINNPDIMRQQYNDSSKLDIRIALHQRYSTNRQPFGDWIMEHYHIQPGMRVLELGCGTGNMWHDAAKWLPKDASLTLTDFSAGMVKTAMANVPALPNISFQQVDIQQIPFEDNSFDLVIANMMLYHVPDLKKGLSEVARVLRPEGRFICATVGAGGVYWWLENTLGIEEGKVYPFSLQNGADILEPHFAQVEMDQREDGLRVTNVEDLVDYVLSMASFSGLKEWPRDMLRERLLAQAVDGVIAIPKEYGLFIASQPV
ncbi:MAG: methyltransferase domain-containing protein [Clostridia bacterium]|nr:methyltransferase domain-containing protein [Clostridia bacterium]